MSGKATFEEGPEPGYEDAVRFIKGPHGILVTDPAPLLELSALMSVWCESYGYDIICPEISSYLGAVMAISNEKEAALWRAKIFKEPSIDLGELERINDWPNSQHTGLSSIAIWEVLSGKPWTRSNDTFRGEIPYDPQDWLRCYKLLQLIPSWYDRLHEVGDKYPRWKPFTDNWHKLEAIYERELKDDKRNDRGDQILPDLYDYLQELREIQTGTSVDSPD